MSIYTRILRGYENEAFSDIRDMLPHEALKLVNLQLAVLYFERVQPFLKMAKTLQDALLATLREAYTKNWDGWVTEAQKEIGRLQMKAEFQLPDAHKEGNISAVSWWGTKMVEGVFTTATVGICRSDKDRQKRLIHYVVEGMTNRALILRYLQVGPVSDAVIASRAHEFSWSLVRSETLRVCIALHMYEPEEARIRLRDRAMPLEIQQYVESYRRRYLAL